MSGEIIPFNIFSSAGLADPASDGEHAMPPHMLPADVEALVLAARRAVARWPHAAALKALDQAADAFAEMVPWEDPS
jgi:hypothetical protein